MKKRLFSALLCFCLLAGLLPAAAFAVETDTGKAIQLGTSAIKKGDSVYYGTCDSEINGYTQGDAIQWQVLDAENDNTGSDGMFLLSKYLLKDIQFEAAGQTNIWQNSDAQEWCKNFVKSSFATGEQTGIKALTKTDNVESLYGVGWGESQLDQDQVFFLSAREASDYLSSYDGADELKATYKNGDSWFWWLRSPAFDKSDDVGLVIDGGAVSKTIASSNYAARPAFNLKLDAVLFSSATVGGKADTAVDGNLTAVGTTGTDWKLTLPDESRSFSANVDGQASVSASAGDNVQITYSGAQTGDNEYVSVLLCDSSDTVLYYGNIARNSESGTASVIIPVDLQPGSYTLKVFSEQYNGDYKTDYASAFQPVDLTVSSNIAGTPAITSQPQDETYIIGDTVHTISVEASASDGGTLSYQWYSNMTDSNSGGTKLDEETNSSYTPDISAEGTTYYYCVVTNTLGGTTAETVSDTAKIEVLPVFEEYDLYIYAESGYNNIRVTNMNASDVLGDGGTVSYDASTCTLTLDNAKIAGIMTYGNEQKTLTINVAGDSVIESPQYNAIRLQGSRRTVSGNRIYYRDKLIITGDGKLTINALGDYTVGISTYDNVTIEEANVEINAANYTAIVIDTQNDPNQGDIDLNIVNSTVTATTKGSETNAFYITSGGIKINNSDVTVQAASSGYPTLWAATGIEITGGSDVTAATGDGNAFYSPGGIKIDGSVVTANGETSYNPAMYANFIEITGGSDVTATTGDGNAIWAADGGILIDNSAVKATVIGEYGSYVIYTYEGDVVIRNGSNVTAESATDTAMICVEGNMTVADSTVIAVGGTCEGIVVDKTLDAKNSTVNISRAAAVSDPAIVVCQLNVEASEITADGGIRFYNYSTGNTDNIAFSMTPASGKLVELKVDDANHDGSAAVHFNKGAESPYDTTVNFDTDAMSTLYDYKYVRIGEHTHAGGTATCTDPVVCDDCGRQYGDGDPDNHSFTNYVYNNDATCTADGTETAECDRCGKTDTREKAGSMLGHNAVKTEAKAATCTEDGNTEYWTCGTCGKYFSDADGKTEIILADTVISATGHTLTHTPAKAATCIEEGNTEYWTCDTCGKHFSDAEGTTEITDLDTWKVIPKLNHTWSADYLKENADADKHYHVCTICGTKDAGEAHTWNVEAATEETDKHCTVCGYVAEEKLGHVHVGKYVAGKDATCTEEGSKEYYSCSCGRFFEDADCKVEITDLDTWKVIPKLNHTWSADYLKEHADAEKHYHICTVCGTRDAGEAHTWNVEAATEETDKHCTVCGYVAEAQLGHVHVGMYVVGEDATCTEDGSKEYYSCSCGKFFEDESCTVEITDLNTWKVIPKVDHTWSADYLEEHADAEKHYHVCTVCGTKDAGENHTWNVEAATEETDRHCTVCGYVAEEKLEPVHNHQGKHISGKDATCTDEGNNEYWYCETCGKYFRDEELTQEITKKETVIEARGHGKAELKNKKEATCTTEGYTGDKVCEDCGEVLEKGETISKLTHSYKDGTCTVCGASDPNYKTAAPTGSGKQSGNAGKSGNVGKSSNSPKTGDNSNIALWIFLMLVAGAALTGTTVYTHKKKRSR